MSGLRVVKNDNVPIYAARKNVPPIRSQFVEQLLEKYLARLSRAIKHFRA